MYSKKTTLKEIAKEADVGRATLARYLKDPDSVKLKTRQKITKILMKYRYFSQNTSSLSYKQRVTYFRPKSESHFLHSLEKSLLSYCALAGIIGKVFYLSSNEDILISQLKKAAEESDILIFSIPHTPKIKHYLELFIQQGKKIITLISDIPGLSKSTFIGIDNVAAGRCAAHMALSYAQNKDPNILILAGDLLLDDHKFRQLGFLQYLEQNNVTKTPNILDCKETRANLDGKVIEAIKDCRSLEIIYSTPMLNERLYRILEKIDRNPRPIVITHELTRASRQGLIDGYFDLVIMQDVDEIAHRTLQVIQALNSGFPLENNKIIWNKIHLITIENMPFDNGRQFLDHLGINHVF